MDRLLIDVCGAGYSTGCGDCRLQVPGVLLIGGIAPHPIDVALERNQRAVAAPGHPGGLAELVVGGWDRHYQDSAVERFQHRLQATSVMVVAAHCSSFSCRSKETTRGSLARAVGERRRCCRQGRSPAVN